MRVDVASATRPYPGERACGDAAVARSCADATLFGIVDALGHGPQAAEVAARAVAYLDAVDLGWPLARIVDGLHVALTHTRGAASGLCIVHGNHLELSTVGNVEVRSLGTRVGVLATPGVLGRRLRSLRTAEFRIEPGDRVVLFSDGISARVAVEDTRGLAPEAACRHILAGFARSSDDASVIVADFTS
jgi:negative regulator of sigma-B (phosphoserine phosphatase)